MERNKGLTVRVLFDYSRGLRGQENSTTVLQDLLHAYPDRCKLYLYHTPKLRGIWKRILPQRIEEAIGVMHMKMYLADDNMLITGYILFVYINLTWLKLKIIFVNSF